MCDFYTEKFSYYKTCNIVDHIKKCQIFQHVKRNKTKSMKLKIFFHLLRQNKTNFLLNQILILILIDQCRYDSFYISTSHQLSLKKRDILNTS